MNWKLLLGIFVVIASLVIGKITLVLFILDFNDLFIRYSMVVIYVLSWPALIFGVYVCGVEGAEYVRRIYQFFSYRYYHEHIKSQIYQRHKNLKDAFRKFR